MMRLFITALLLGLYSCSNSKIVRAPSSIVLLEEDGKVLSALVNQEVPYWIVKPSGNYPNLPVVFFLHGRGGSARMFKDIGGVEALKSHIEYGRQPFAVIGLTGTFQGKDTYWVNDANPHGMPWADAILKEIIPKLEKQHQLGGLAKRMIAGISMGSHGAFQLALNSEGMFKCVAGHSIVMRDYQSLSTLFPGVFGTREEFRARNPMSLLKKYNLFYRPQIQKVWIDIGGRDSAEFIRWAKPFKRELIRVGFSERRQSYLDVARDNPLGDHTYSYWHQRLPEYLEWYGQCFNN